ncbi:hypothetical protein AXF42_Ash017753 [Apostasia shenzhenica]|uniref:Rab-GAP TBC domain-containing protein n=1 Tax=Apostasia shenzhenica TaxID=1088818 RepID=A0A2I0B675_9ASPA|nr:hypothetical protein AXF42_Ash017753 [Apostasia shenzhenica]
MADKSPPLASFEHKRDAYGFAVRPQHLQRYRQYAKIYKEEEEERSDRWKKFLESQADKNHFPAPVDSEETAMRDLVLERERPHLIQLWSEIRPSLAAIEELMSCRLKKKHPLNENGDAGRTSSSVIVKPLEDYEDVFYDVERSDLNQEVFSKFGRGTDSAVNMADQGKISEPSIPWKEELEFLVRGGLPMALRGELWQAFVGVGKRRKEGYYENLLSPKTKTIDCNGVDDFASSDAKDVPKKPKASPSHKWKTQIEKDLPRTFPGHPALEEDGRNALRRLLTAYARHNPSVGYCQAMNFFAGLLLLLMPEENAFWTLLGIIDDYFDGYYSEEMTESQVDQLVLEELVLERFPKLFNHLNYLGVEMAWITGPWFLSIFVNMLPWESVLRIWDVFLFEGNRVMLFRTALALMEFYGPALVTTKDAGDAVTLLQSLASSTFDSSQLVLAACVGYAVNEARLVELRNKHRPAVIASMEERMKGFHLWKNSRGLPSKLYASKCDSELQLPDANSAEGLNGLHGIDGVRFECVDGFLGSLAADLESDSGPDLTEQVTWLKSQLCRLLEENQSASLRSNELEMALIEMVKHDNRRLLSAKVEQLEQKIIELQQTLSVKEEQEQAMLEVLMRVEQEQKVTEDARMFAEQDAVAQKYYADMLQEKYTEAMASLAQMEKRVIMSETMLEATLQYQSSQTKAQLSSPSPRAQSDNSHSRTSQELQEEVPPRKVSLLSRPFGLVRGDRSKDNKKCLEELDQKTNVHGTGDEDAPPARDIDGHRQLDPQ